MPMLLSCKAFSMFSKFVCCAVSLLPWLDNEMQYDCFMFFLRAYPLTNQCEAGETFPKSKRDVEIALTAWAFKVILTVY